MVKSDRTQSTFSVGIGNGFHRSWLGVTMPWLNSAVRFSAGNVRGSEYMENV